MSRQYVFLVHGMGVQPEGTWHEPFVSSIIEELTRYTPFRGMDPAEIDEKYIRFIPISYDKEFTKYRDDWKDMAGDVAAAMCNADPKAGAAFRALRDSAEQEGGLEGFFWSHLLDALLWYTCPQVRKDVVSCVNKQLADALRVMTMEERTNTAHIVAHSLGTTVIHDSLVGMYHSPVHEELFGNHSHVWRTVVMVANVGRFLETQFTLNANVDRKVFEVYRSVLSPVATNSICANYINVHHKIDPFTWPRPFKRPFWPWESYMDIEPIYYRELHEVHDFDHYLADPHVHIPVLRKITQLPSDFAADEDEQNEALGDFKGRFEDEAKLEFDHLRARVGGNPDRDFSTDETLMFLYRVLKELPQ